MDIEGASDNTLYAVMQDALIYKGVRKSLAFEIGKMLQNRQLEVSSGINSVVLNKILDYTV